MCCLQFIVYRYGCPFYYFAWPILRRKFGFTATKEKSSADERTSSAHGESVEQSKTLEDTVQRKVSPNSDKTHHLEVFRI